MNKCFTLLGLFCLSFVLSGQEKSIKWYGFIRNAFYADTYRGTGSVQDQFYLLPVYAGKDSDGEHINRHFQSNMTAVASRLGARITGPEIFKAKSSARMEFDFSGLTSAEPSLFRIRLAYMQLDWEKSSLLVGQNWHPFWGDATFPQIGSLNTGAPFQPFNRSPQVRFDVRLNESVTILFAGVYENQFTSRGFYNINNGVDKTKPLRYSGLPELLFMAKYHKDNITLGAGAEYKSILPIDTVSPGGSGAYKTNARNNSFGLTAYANYKSDKLYVLLKGTYGQNLTHLTMTGGYGVKSVDAHTGAYDYTNYTNYTTFLNLKYGRKWQAGFITGFAANLGTSDPLISLGGAPKTAGLFPTLKCMYRVSPSFTLNHNCFRLTAEYEMTGAEHSDSSTAFDYTKGLYEGSVNATNHRLLLTMMYLF